LFGKHTTYPYHKNPVHEVEVLEWVHIDIWGPSPILSAGGCMYFMVITDGYSSYRMVTFLKSKSADITLNMLKAYQVEAEQQLERS